ncbi:hypothetical protein DFH09DRAFT_321612 [Mycena vulgaris]|nr:hypothetical protein DFH09DRAFT_321612 [Mycena vulgaris]
MSSDLQEDTAHTASAAEDILESAGPISDAAAPEEINFDIAAESAPRLEVVDAIEEVEPAAEVSALEAPLDPPRASSPWTPSYSVSVQGSPLPVATNLALQEDTLVDISQPTSVAEGIESADPILEAPTPQEIDIVAPTLDVVDAATVEETSAEAPTADELAPEEVTGVAEAVDPIPEAAPQEISLGNVAEAEATREVVSNTTDEPSPYNAAVEVPVLAETEVTIPLSTPILIPEVAVAEDISAPSVEEDLKAEDEAILEESTAASVEDVVALTETVTERGRQARSRVGTLSVVEVAPATSEEAPIDNQVADAASEDVAKVEAPVLEEAPEINSGISNSEIVDSGEDAAAEDAANVKASVSDEDGSSAVLAENLATTTADNAEEFDAPDAGLVPGHNMEGISLDPVGEPTVVDDTSVPEMSDLQEEVEIAPLDEPIVELTQGEEATVAETPSVTEIADVQLEEAEIGEPATPEVAVDAFIADKVLHTEVADSEELAPEAQEETSSIDHEEPSLVAQPAVDSISPEELVAVQDPIVESSSEAEPSVAGLAADGFETVADAPAVDDSAAPESQPVASEESTEAVEDAPVPAGAVAYEEPFTASQPESPISSDELITMQDPVVESSPEEEALVEDSVDGVEAIEAAVDDSASPESQQVASEESTEAVEDAPVLAEAVAHEEPFTASQPEVPITSDELITMQDPVVESSPEEEALVEDAVDDVEAIEVAVDEPVATVSPPEPEPVAPTVPAESTEIVEAALDPAVESFTASQPEAPISPEEVASVQEPIAQSSLETEPSVDGLAADDAVVDESTAPEPVASEVPAESTEPVEDALEPVEAVAHEEPFTAPQPEVDSISPEQVITVQEPVVEDQEPAAESSYGGATDASVDEPFEPEPEQISSEIPTESTPAAAEVDEEASIVELANLAPQKAVDTTAVEEESLPDIEVSSADAALAASESAVDKVPEPVLAEEPVIVSSGTPAAQDLQVTSTEFPVTPAVEEEPPVAETTVVEADSEQDPVVDDVVPAVEAAAVAHAEPVVETVAEHQDPIVEDAVPVADAAVATPAVEPVEEEPLAVETVASEDPEEDSVQDVAPPVEGAVIAAAVESELADPAPKIETASVSEPVDPSTSERNATLDAPLEPVLSSDSIPSHPAPEIQPTPEAADDTSVPPADAQVDVSNASEEPANEATPVASVVPLPEQQSQAFPLMLDVSKSADADASDDENASYLDAPPVSPRSRLESTASSMFFPGGWFSKIPEGRASLDVAQGEFSSSKPNSPSISSPNETPNETEQSEEKKGKWCVVM